MVVTFQTLVGIFLDAVVIGVIFARISHPKCEIAQRCRLAAVPFTKSVVRKLKSHVYTLAASEKTECLSVYQAHQRLP